LAVDSPDIIQCQCGQRMRVPADSPSLVFKCVRCGALVEREGVGKAGAAGNGTDDKSKSGSGGVDVLLEVFLSGGLINEEQKRVVQAEYQPDKERIFQTLFRLEFVTPEQFHAFMAKESGTAVINLAHFNIDRHLTELIPYEMILKHWVLPIDKLGRSLTVAMVCPMDTDSIAVMEQYSGLRLRPMLCNVDDFRHSLDKHYRRHTEQEETLPSHLAPRAPAVVAREAVEAIVEPAKGRDDILETLARIEALPIQSRVMNLVDATVGTGPQGLRQIIEVVQKSPPFAAKLLCTANSQAFGLPGNVESIPMAVALLGDEAISMIAGVLPKCSSATERQWFPLNRFSRTAAGLAAVFAGACGRVVPGVAFCAGLLHGIGIYALGEVDPEEHRKIDPRLVGTARLGVERKMFGVTHNEAGEVLCRNWNLPEIICAAIGAYPDPSQSETFRDIAELVFIATQLATAEGNVDREGLSRCAQSFAYLQIDPAGVSGLLEEQSSANLGA